MNSRTLLTSLQDDDDAPANVILCSQGLVPLMKYPPPPPPPPPPTTTSTLQQEKEQPEGEGKEQVSDPTNDDDDNSNDEKKKKSKCCIILGRSELLPALWKACGCRSSLQKTTKHVPKTATTKTTPTNDAAGSNHHGLVVLCADCQRVTEWAKQSLSRKQLQLELVVPCCGSNVKQTNNRMDAICVATHDKVCDSKAEPSLTALQLYWNQTSPYPLFLFRKNHHRLVLATPGNEPTVINHASNHNKMWMGPLTLLQPGDVISFLSPWLVSPSSSTHHLDHTNAQGCIATAKTDKDEKSKKKRPQYVTMERIPHKDDDDDDDCRKSSMEFLVDLVTLLPQQSIGWADYSQTHKDKANQTTRSTVGADTSSSSSSLSHSNDTRNGKRPASRNVEATPASIDEPVTVPSRTVTRAASFPPEQSANKRQKSSPPTIHQVNNVVSSSLSFAKRMAQNGRDDDDVRNPKHNHCQSSCPPPVRLYFVEKGLDMSRAHLQGTAKLEGLYTRARKRGAIVLKQFDKSLVDAKATAEIEESSCQKLLPTHFVVTDNVDHLLSTTMLAQTLGFDTPHELALFLGKYNIVCVKRRWVAKGNQSQYPPFGKPSPIVEAGRC